MDILKTLKKQTDDFQKYRRYQARLTKIKNAPASPKNIKPAMALLAQINALLKEMDARAEETQAYIKAHYAKPKVQAEGKLPVTN